MDDFTGDPLPSLHRNTSLILAESFKSKKIVWVMEVLIFCFEIGIIFDSRILKLILQSKSRKYLETWEITSLLTSDIFSELGFQFENPSRLLTGALFCIMILGASIYRLTRSRPTGSSQEYLKSFTAVNLAAKDKPLFPDDIFWLFLRYAIYLAPYLARIYLLFFWAGISCTPVIKEVAWKGDNTILPTSNDQLSMVLSIFNNVIVYESSLFTGEQCFSGSQIILTLCWIVVGMQLAFLLTMHHRVTDFIPIPHVILGKSSQWIEWLDIGLFALLYLMKAITTKFLEESVAPVILWFFLIFQIGFYCLHLIYKPYYCMDILNWRIVKHLILASLGAWLLILQHASFKGTFIASQTLLKFEFFWLVTLTLLIAFVARLSLQRIKLSELLGRLGEQVGNAKYSTISLSDVKLLVYVFCKLRDAVATGKPGAFSTKEMSRIKFMFSQLFLAHRSACSDKLCFCCSREVYLKAIKMHRLDARLPTNLKWVTDVIFTCQFVLDKKLASMGGESVELKGNKEFTAFFILWSVFSVENYGNTIAILSILSKLLKQDRQNTSSKLKKHSFFGGLCSASWRAEVLKSFLKLVIENQSKYLDSVPWTTAFVSESCKDTEKAKNQVRWVTNQFVIVNEYLNDLNITAELITDAISWKIEFLSTMSFQKKTKVLTCSDNYLDNCERVERMFRKLNLPNQMVYFKTALLKLSYLLKVKEDFVAGKQLLSRTAQSRVSSNILSSLEQSEISRSVILIIGAESENFHEIVGCTSNLRDWGYSLSEIVGADLNSILPEVVSEFHKPMLKKAFKETGWNSQMLETRVPLAQGIISSTGDYIPIVIYIKLNCLLTFGFQIFGFCVPRLDTAPVELVLDSMGMIRNMTKSAKTIFKQKSSFLEYSRVLTGLLQKLTAKEYQQMRVSDQELAASQQFTFSSAQKPANVWSPERQSHATLETELWLPLGVVAEEQIYKGAVNRVRLLVRATSNYKSKSLFYNFLFTIDPDCPSLKDEDAQWQETISNDLFEEAHEASSDTGIEQHSKTSYDTPQDSEHSLPEELSAKDTKKNGQSPKSSRKGGALLQKPPSLDIAHKLIGAKSVISDTNIPRELADAVTQALDPHALVAYLSKLPETQGLDSPRPPSQIFARLHLKSSREVELFARVLSSGLSSSRRHAKQSEVPASLLHLTKVQTGMRTPTASGIRARRNGILLLKTGSNKLRDTGKPQSRDLASKTKITFNALPRAKANHTSLPRHKASISSSGSSLSSSGSLDPAGLPRPQANAPSSKMLKYEHLSETIVSFGEEELSLLQTSRFLHHTLNVTKGIRLLSGLLAIPWILVAVVGYLFYLRESLYSYRFDAIVTDVLCMDASGYLAWMSLNYATYFNMRRMAIEGVLPPGLFKDYGYGNDTYLEHYQGMVNKDSYYGVLAIYERKMWKTYQTSEFKDFYDEQLNKNSLDNMYSTLEMTINTFDTGLKLVETDFFKGMQYMSPVFDKIEAGLVPLEPWNYTLGDNIAEVALRASRKLGDYSEYFVYTNILNPILKDFYQSVENFISQLDTRSMTPLWVSVLCYAFMASCLGILVWIRMKGAANKFKLYYTFQFETLEAKAAVRRPGNQDSLQLSWQGKPEHVPLKQQPLKKQSKISWQLRDTVAGRNQPQIELGFRLRESLLKAFFLTVVMTVTGFVRYSVVADSVEPVAFCVDAANLNAALYNYMILQDRALIDAIGWSDTSELLGRKPSQVFGEVSDKVRSLIDRMLIKYRTNRIGEDIDAYKQLMNANMCDILAKTLEEPGSRYPNCDIAMAGIVNNSFALFIDKYAQLKDQIMSQWAREPTLESKRAVLYRQETVSYLSYLTINTFGTTDAIYYHFMYPMVSILQGKVVDLQKALKLANVVTGLLGFVCVLAGVALQVAVFRKEYLRFMSILFIVPVGLLVTNAKMKFKLQKSLKDCTSKLNL